MPGRKFTSTTNYRYGFNGKEEDDEVKGDGNQIAYEERIYDSRLGRWLSLDPLQKKYPGETNYGFVSNNPIIFADVDGRDKIYTLTIINKDGTVHIKKWTDKDFFIYKHISISGFGNDLYYKQDLHINVTIDLNTNSGSYSQELGSQTRIPAGIYAYNKMVKFFNDRNNTQGSQNSGIAFTSKFSIQVDGPNTIARIENGGMVNIDALLALGGAASKSREPIKPTIDELGEILNLGQELQGSVNDGNEKMEARKSEPVYVTETVEGKWDYYERDKKGRLQQSSRTDAEAKIRKEGKNGDPDTIYQKVYSKPPPPKKDIPRKN
ncbi:MAG: hypothetical protein KGZ74_07140 [Chitinophagaceae bacterium]|nr:hypothetical protein [Chitinophagaceae bacterium]